MGFCPAPAEVLRGSSGLKQEEWGRCRDSGRYTLPFWGGKDVLRGQWGKRQGSACGFAMATRPVSIGFGSWAWTWARRAEAGADPGVGQFVGRSVGPLGWLYDSKSHACSLG